jgi:hypothetical protein
MSTKTTFKRVALVAVAALGFGMLSVVPSNAVLVTTSAVLSTSASTVTTTVGVAATATISLATVTAETAAGSIVITPTITSQPTLAVPATVGTPASGVVGLTTAVVTGNLAAAALVNAWTNTITAGVETLAWSSGTIPAFSATAVSTLSFTPASPGTYVIALTPTGAVTTNTAVTVTIVARAATYTLGDGAAVSPFSTGNGIAGAANTVTVSGWANGQTGARSLVAVSGASSLISSASNATIASGGASAVIPALGTSTFAISTPVAGTITVSIYNETGNATGIFSATAANTVTITVNGVAQSGSFSIANSTSFLNTTTGTAATADAVVSASSALPAAQVAQIVITLKDTLLATYSGAISASVAGPGTLGAGNAANPASTGRAVTSAVAGGTQYVSVWSDGTTGTAVITLSVGSTVVGTETVSFYGPLTTLTATVISKQILTSAVKTGAVTVVGKDATGNIISVTPTVSSATSASIASGTCSASTSTAASSCSLTAGATAGSAVLTFAVGLISTTATVSAAAKPTTVTLAFDKMEYASGEPFVLTLTATNAAGVAGDATYAALLAGPLTTSQSITSALFAASVVLVDGKATAKGFMPLSAGSLVVTGTTGVDATTAAVAVTATATVISNGLAEAALDAATEATDAANAATDAANAAAEAADAATAAAQDAADAVAALSTQVAEMINSLKKQITALTNLVIKIQKKVKA